MKSGWLAVGCLLLSYVLCLLMYLLGAMTFFYVYEFVLYSACVFLLRQPLSGFRERPPLFEPPHSGGTLAGGPGPSEFLGVEAARRDYTESMCLREEEEV